MAGQHNGGRRRARPKLSATYISKWLRVLSNIFAGVLILGTGVLVLLLLYQGMFYSQWIRPMALDKWNPMFKSCRLDALGFVPGTCDDEEVQSTGDVAWASIGAQLAMDLLRNESDGQVFVTTCLIGGYENAAWATVMFVVGGDIFPDCHPVGEQAILGMAALETIGNDDFPFGAYLLSTFSDARPFVGVTIPTADGPVNVAQSTIKTIVTTDGSKHSTPWDTHNYVASVNSLNRLFFMRLWVVAHFFNISNNVKSLDGYSFANATGIPVAFGWDNSHHVDHYLLLLAFQSLVCFVSLGLLSNDGVITLEGLSGLLKNKPVLTYDILASLERRKLLLVSLVCTFFFSPLYADAIRYTYPATGYHYWSLTLLMVAVMMALSWMALLTALQSLPVPARWRNRPLCYSAPVFVYCTILFFVVTEAAQDRGRNEYEGMWSHADSTLGLYIHGRMWSAGAYSLDGMTPVIYLLMPDLIVCVVAAWVVSIAAHKVLVGYVVLDTSWTSHNDFVSQLPMPQWVTSLDLDHKNTISIGNKLYCKPSLMVLLGYCTIRGRSGADVSSDMTNGKHASSHHSSTVEIILTRKESSMAATQMTGSRYPTPLAAHHSPPKAVKGDYIVIRIYDLVAAIVPWIRTWVYSPKVFGMIASNKFELTKSHIRLEKKSTYSYSRGDCCG